MRAWQPIACAPKDGSYFDVWAKSWIASQDRFEFRRFTDCYFARPLDSAFDSQRTELNGVEKDWCAVHWIAPPEAPTEKADKPLHRIWLKRDRNWAKAAGEYTITTDIRTLGEPANSEHWIEFIEVPQP